MYALSFVTIFIPFFPLVAYLANKLYKKSSSSAAWSSLSDNSFDLPKSYLLASTWPRVASSSLTSFYYFSISASSFFFYYALNASDLRNSSCFSALSYLAIKLSTSDSALFGCSSVGAGGKSTTVAYALVLLIAEVSALDSSVAASSAVSAFIAAPIAASALSSSVSLYKSLIFIPSTPKSNAIVNFNFIFKVYKK